MTAPWTWGSNAVWWCKDEHRTTMALPCIRQACKFLGNDRAGVVQSVGGGHCLEAPSTEADTLLKQTMSLYADPFGKATTAVASVARASFGKTQNAARREAHHVLVMQGKVSGGLGTCRHQVNAPVVRKNSHGR